ncbi:hypothetical protein BpHYR1_004957 [Brachionus plicatilis]|uniref:Uncharacterized protein n=1 Tax=Brachionus plicatilis TaxID=10195 RepID=A0A3M7RK11_BRAPC|nr:hypothetical protein BpHYR1_004957 [Brachionus plicatilis]
MIVLNDQLQIVVISSVDVCLFSKLAECPLEKKNILITNGISPIGIQRNKINKPLNLINKLISIYYLKHCLI